MPIELFHFTLTHASVPLLNLFGLGSHSVQSQKDTLGSDQSLQVVKRAENTGDAVGLVKLAVKEAVEVNQEGIHPLG